MEILLNGESKKVPDSFTVAQLVDELAAAGKRFAVEVNLQIVPRSLYGRHQLRPGDRVEVVHAIGGG